VNNNDNLLDKDHFVHLTENVSELDYPSNDVVPGTLPPIALKAQYPVLRGQHGLPRGLTIHLIESARQEDSS
jgi:hypothetical protein